MTTRLILQYPGDLDNELSDQAVEMLTPDGERRWPVVAAATSGVIFRHTALHGGIYSRREGGDDLLARHLSFVADRGMETIVNVPTRFQCAGRGELLDKIARQFERLSYLGFVVDAFQVQSWYSGRVWDGDCPEVYPKGGALVERIEDVRDFLDMAGGWFPHARLIVADTGAAKDDPDHRFDWDYKSAYLALVDALRRDGHPDPAFLLAWAKEEARADYGDVVAARDFFRAHGLSWGLKPITDSADVSAARFELDLVAFVRGLRDAGALPDELVLTSWNRRYPKRMLPEDRVGTLTSAGRQLVDLGLGW